MDIICNRVCATIKALQLLGNSVQGLDHTWWKLAYSAICLPVLTYGCQLWYRGKQKGLVDKLQKVQNDAVKTIAGAFRTTPREPLHQLLNIFPMAQRLDMLTQNSALRLYRLPRESQLLVRLGGDWRTPVLTDHTLPSPNRKGAKTTLRGLAARAPVNGPRIDPFPEIPAGAPSWNGRVRTLPKHDKREYNDITTVLVESCKRGYSVNIHCEGLVSNRNREDNQQVGAASAVIYDRGREHTHREKTYGVSVTDADTSLLALSLGLEALSDFLHNQDPDPPVQGTVVILTSAAAAIGRALDATPHEGQTTSIQCIRSIEDTLRAHPNLNIRLGWLPKAAPFVGCKRARQLAFEAVRTAALDEENEPHTIRSQQQTAKQSAIDAWATKWHADPHNSLAYQLALTGPPDGRPHPTYITPTDLPTPRAPANGARAPQGPGNPLGIKVKFSRKNFSTLYHIITGHAFIGAYTERFHPQHTPDQVACPCGEPVETVEHVLLHCPLHADARHKHLTNNGRPRGGLQQLFRNPERVLDVLRFLEETGACAKPRGEWEPG